MPITNALHVMLKWVIVSKVREAKGVYALYNSSEELIFYGLAVESLRKSLLEHLMEEEDTCCQSAWYFRYEVTDYPITRERQLLIEYIKEYHGLPACNELKGVEV